MRAVMQGFVLALSFQLFCLPWTAMAQQRVRIVVTEIVIDQIPGSEQESAKISELASEPSMVEAVADFTKVLEKVIDLANIISERMKEPSPTAFPPATSPIPMDRPTTDQDVEPSSVAVRVFLEDEIQSVIYLVDIHSNLHESLSSTVATALSRSEIEEYWLRFIDAGMSRRQVRRHSGSRSP